MQWAIIYLDDVIGIADDEQHLLIIIRRIRRLDVSNRFSIFTQRYYPTPKGHMFYGYGKLFNFSLVFSFTPQVVWIYMETNHTSIKQELILWCVHTI